MKASWSHTFLRAAIIQIELLQLLRALGGNTTKWTFERCIEVCAKYKKRSEVEIAEKSAYRAILKNGWQAECFAHMGSGKIIKYSTEHLLDVISRVKSISELASKYPLETTAIRKRSEFKDWTQHLTRKRKKHTAESILKAASQCRNASEFLKRFPDEYKAAKRLGIFGEGLVKMRRET